MSGTEKIRKKIKVQGTFIRYSSVLKYVLSKLQCVVILNSPAPQLSTWFMDAPCGFDVFGIYEIVNGCYGAGNDQKEIFMDLVREAFES